MSFPRPTRAPFPWAEPLFTFGITGTNGKTSTSHLIAHAIRACGHKDLLLGTTGYFFAGEALAVPRTVGGFHRAFELAATHGGHYAAVECTSNALAHGYAQRWRFDLGVFTNLSPEHLETHGSWEHYLAAKAQLFVHLGAGRTGVLNACDRHALYIDHAMPPDVKRVYYASPTRGPALRPADLSAAAVEVSVNGTRVVLEPSPMAERLGGELTVRMVGAVFGENAIAAAAAALVAGLDPSGIVEGLGRCPTVTGRFEVVSHAPVVVVDYAHSPDALERALATARELSCGGRVIVVFGAGGERTPQKREPMGRVAGRSADVAIVTNDNPRGEDPVAIAAMIEKGLRAGRARLVVELDRARAIARAISLAGPADVVIVAGKGHETGQEIGSETVPFSDHAVIRRILGA